MITRRNFMASLTAFGIGTVALSIPGRSFRGRVGSWLRPPQLQARNLKPESFAGLTGTHLTLRAPGGKSARARLVDVSGLEHFQKHSARRLNQMSLLFEVPAGTSLSEGMHNVEHPLAGSCELYLTPVGPVGRTRQFEAVISRLA